MKETQGIVKLLISLDEAASRLSVCRRTVEREIAHGRFPRPLKVGRSTRIAVADLDSYLESLKKPTARRDYIAASITKQGAIAPSPQILDLIDSHRQGGMSKAEYERLSAQYSKEVAL